MMYDSALQWYDALRSSYFKIDHFDLNQTIGLQHEVTSLSELQLNSTSYLLIGTGHCSSFIYRRRVTESSYSFAAIISGTGSVSKWLPLNRAGFKSYYIASLSSATSHCNGTSAILWRFSLTEKDRIEMKSVRNFGSDIVDITGETIHNLHYLHTVGSGMKEWKMFGNRAENGVTYVIAPSMSSSQSTSNSTINPLMRLASASDAVPKLNIYERSRPVISESSFSSEVKIHSFRLGSKSMIVQIFPSSDSPIGGCHGVKVFSTNTGSMKLEQVIPACDVQNIITFTFGNFPDHYLVLAERGDVGIYHYEGASGFVRRFSLPYPIAKSLKWIHYQNDGLIAVAKQDRVTIFKAVTIGDYVRD